MEKGRNCSPGAISPLFHNILYPDFRFLYLNKDQIRDKRLFEITEVEITRVDYICKTDCKNVWLYQGYGRSKSYMFPVHSWV